MKFLEFITTHGANVLLNTEKIVSVEKVLLQSGFTQHTVFCRYQLIHHIRTRIQPYYTNNRQGRPLMNEFDNFVNEREKAIKRSENHIADLRKMETIEFMERPRLSEIDRKIQTQIALANIKATLKMNLEIEDKLKRVCSIANACVELIK